jgi:Protein of unknown function, DUF488
MHGTSETRSSEAGKPALTKRVRLPREIFTVGYSGKTVDEFIAALHGAGIERVIDVRALPLSRRRGFSKTALGNTLAEFDIEYVHIRAAGNPFRELKNEIDKCLALYARHLDAHPAIVDEVAVALTDRRAALLCVEAEPEHCHRSVIVSRLSLKHGKHFVTHL